MSCLLEDKYIEVFGSCPVGKPISPKRRASAYHSQGNGFTERNIRNIREVIRTLLLAQKLPQSSWAQLLSGITFALNTSISQAIKCTPFEVIFGRKAVLPIDVALDMTTQSVRHISNTS